jgi:predicted metal-binding transcription factor (methanogenesis marker protein 9)
MAELALVNFDQLIKRLRFNLESAKSALEPQPEESKSPEDLEALRKYVYDMEDTVRKLEIANEVAQKEMPTDEDIRRVMNITCYGNIGYCCGLAKECVWRDSCRQALGIDDETYASIKEAVIWQLLKRSKKAGEVTQ